MINSDGFPMLNQFSSMKQRQRIALSFLYFIFLYESLNYYYVPLLPAIIGKSYHYEFHEFKGEERLREALTDPAGPAEETGPAPVSPRDARSQPSFTNGQF